MSRLLRLPASGRLLVCTDLQGNLSDFHAMAEIFEKAAHTAANVHLVFAGDLVHGPLMSKSEWEPWLGDFYEDRSPELFDAFEELSGRYPGQVHALLGNHEHAHIGGARTAKFFPDEAAHLETRMGPARTDRFRAWCRDLPLVAMSPSGVVVTHAAPAARIADVAELEIAYTLDPVPDSIEAMMRVPVLGQLLWARGCAPDVARAFLRVILGRPGGFGVYGHDVVREGFEIAGEGEQLCLSTSFGLFDAHKRYLDLPLDGCWESAHELVEGEHLRALYPHATPHPVWGRDYL
jgi:hypothetical protein